MSLVRVVNRHGPRQAIVRGIFRNCEDLGIDIVAEGVETLDEYEWLRGEGIIYFTVTCSRDQRFGPWPQQYFRLFDAQRVVGQTGQIRDVIGNLRGTRIIQR